MSETIPWKPVPGNYFQLSEKERSAADTAAYMRFYRREFRATIQLLRDIAEDCSPTVQAMIAEHLEQYNAYDLGETERD